MRALAKDVWTADRPFRAYGLDIGGRMTAVKLPDGSLLLHSPVALDPALRREIEALGPVRHLVAPNRFHHLYVSEHLDAWPEAKLWAAPRLAKKRPDLRIDGTLGDEPPAAWGGALDTLVIEGVPALNEVALLHRPSRTLLLSDHLFTFDRTAPWPTRIAARLLRIYERPAWLSFGFLKDRAAMRASIDRLLGWDFDRVVVAHGAVLERDGHEAVRRAYARH